MEPNVDSTWIMAIALAGLLSIKTEQEVRRNRLGHRNGVVFMLESECQQALGVPNRQRINYSASRRRNGAQSLMQPPEGVQLTHRAYAKRAAYATSAPPPAPNARTKRRSEQPTKQTAVDRGPRASHWCTSRGKLRSWPTREGVQSKTRVAFRCFRTCPVRILPPESTIATVRPAVTSRQKSAATSASASGGTG